MPSSRKFTIEFKVKTVELAKKSETSSKFEGPRWMKYKLEIQDWEISD